jgi:TetR/AcrR family transcriptional regulator, transcriptional repressor for nem operon
MCVMARPKEFERDAVLHEAIKVFCDRGFAGASTDAVLDAMHISRQSMYDTFGDKRKLYLAALERYTENSVSAIVRSVETAPTPLAGIEAAWMDFASRPSAEAALGCMGVGSICEFGVSDEVVHAINEASGKRLVKTFERAVAEGKRAGEIGADIDVGDAVRFILAVFSGMKISARRGDTRHRLRGIARMALRSLR